MAQQGRINFGVGFQIDKTGLNDFKRSIAEIQGLTAKDIKIPGLNAEQATEQLQKVQQEALKLEQALQKSYNIKLGTYDAEKFNKILKEQGTNLQQVKQSLQSTGAIGQQTWNNFSRTFTSINKELTVTKGLLDKIGDTLFNTIKWSIASNAVNTFTGSIEKAFNYVQKLDTSLNDIRIVTNKSANEMREFAKEANKAAQALGATTTDYSNASLIYYQQGLSDQEVQARTETTVKVANVTGQSTSEVSDQLTAIWNGYKVSAEEAELYIDKVSAVAASTGADLEELSEGMGKVASAANSMGVDIDQLNASLATVITVTREDANAVGTAFKTIYARMGDLVVDGEDEFGTKLGDVSGQLQQMGVDILDTNGDMRDMGDIMEEVASKWDTWTEAQQRAAAVALAGKRQYNNLIALFENWDMYESAKAISTAGAGTLEEQQKIYKESLEASLNEMTAAAQGIYDSLFDSESFIEVIDLATEFLGVIENIVDVLGGGGQVLQIIGGLLINIFSKKIAIEINNLVNKFNEWRSSSQSLTSSLANFDILEEINKDVNKVTNSALELEKIANRLFKKGFISEEGYERLQNVSKSMIDIANREAKLKEDKKMADSIVGKGNIDWKSIEEQGGTGVAAQDAQSLLQSDVESIQKLTEGAQRYTKQWETLTEFRTKNGRLVKAQLDQQNSLVKTYEQQLAKLKAQEKLDEKAISATKADLENAKKKTKELEQQYNAYKKAADLIKKQSAGISKNDFDDLMQSGAISDQTKDQLQSLLNEAESKNAAIFGGNAHQLIGAEGQEAGRAFIEAYIAALQEGQENIQAVQQTVLDAKNIAEDKARAATIKVEEELKAARAEGIQQLTQTIGITMQLTSLMNNFVSIFQSFNEGDPSSGLKAIAGTALQLGMLLPQLIPLLKTLFTTIKTGFAQGATAAKAFQASLGVIGIALMALSLIIEGITMAIDAQAAAEEKRLQSLEKQRDELMAKTQENSSLDALYQKYISLIAKYQETGEETEELKTVTEELCKAFGLEMDAIDKVTGKYEKLNKEAVNARLEQAKTAYNDAVNAVDSAEYTAGTKITTVERNAILKPIKNDDGTYRVENLPNVYTTNGVDAITFSAGAAGAHFDELGTVSAIQAEFDTLLANSDTKFDWGVQGQEVVAVKADRTNFTEQDKILFYNTLAQAQKNIQARALHDESLKHEITWGAFEGGESFSYTQDWTESNAENIEAYNTAQSAQKDAMLAYADALVQSAGTEIENVNTTAEYNEAKAKMIDRVRELYDQEGIEYTEESLAEDVDEYFNKYVHLQDDALNSKLRKEFAAIMGDADGKNKAVQNYLNELENSGELELAANAIQEYGLSDRTDTTVAEVKEAVSNYKIKTTFDALSKGKIGELQKLVLQGQDFEEQLKELRKNPKFKKQLEDFENKTVLQQMAILASLEVESAASAAGYKGDLADIGTDKATVKFNDLAAAVNSVVYPLSAIQEATGLIGEGFVIAAKDAEKFSELAPELLEGATINADGSIQLDPDVIQKNIDKVLEAAGQEPEDLIAQLEAQIQNTSDIALKAQYTALLSALKQALGFADTGINEIAGRAGNLANVDYYRVANRKIDKHEKQVEKLKNAYDKLQNVVAQQENLKRQNRLLEDNLDLLKTKLSILKQIDQQNVKELAEEDMFDNGLPKNLFNARGEVNLDVYTKLYEEYLSDEDKKNDPRYQKFFDALDQYIEDFHSINNEIDNTLNTIDDNKSKILDITLEATIKTNEKGQQFLDNIKSLTENDISFDIVSFTQDEITASLERVDRLKQDITKIMSSDVANKDELIAEKYQAIINETLNFQEILNGVEDQYLEKLNERIEKYEAYISQLEQVTELYNHQLEMVKLLSGENAFTEMSNAYTSIADVAEKKQAASLNKLKETTAERDAWIQDYYTANNMTPMKDVNGQWVVTAAMQEEEEYKVLTENAAAAALEWTSSVSEAVTAVQNKFFNNIEIAFKTFEDSLLSGIADSMEELTEEWNWIQEQDERYLDNINAAYELVNLDRKFAQNISSTTTIAAQQKINQLRNQELSILRQKDKLTQYDIDRANKRLEIMQAEIALQEAQENKSKMRLVRGANGQYSYQYVADSDAIANAQEELAQLNNELYNIDKEEYMNTLSDIMDKWTELQEKIKEVANDPNMDVEAKNAKIRDIVSSGLTGIKELATSSQNIFNNLGNSISDGMLESFGEIDTIDLLATSGAAELTKVLTSSTIDAITETLINDVIFAGNILEEEIDDILGAYSDKEGSFYEDTLNTLADALSSFAIAIEPLTEGNLVTDDYMETIKELRDIWDDIAADAIIYANAIKDYGDYNSETLVYLGTLITQGIQRREADNSKHYVHGTTGEGVASWVASEIAHGGSGSILGYYGGEHKSILSDSEIYWLLVLAKSLYTGSRLKEAEKFIIDWALDGRTAESIQRIIQANSFDTGGYTGEWGTDGRLAMLHEKELVLNKMDTANILQAVDLVRNFDAQITSRLAQYMDAIDSFFKATSLEMGANDFEQNVHITAEFPNATDKNEITEAFKDLVNLATQRAFENTRT